MALAFLSPNDPVDLRSALDRVLSDSDYRELLGRRARARIGERYTLAEMAKGWDRVYQQVLGKDRHG